MADDDGATGATTTTTDDGDTGDDTGDPRATLGESGKRALAAERKARRDAERRADDLAARLKVIEDKDKSETERLVEENTRLKAELDAATTSEVRHRVALAKGLTPVQAKRLVGDTEEELSADADDLLESWGARPNGDRNTPPPGARPHETLRPGSGDPDAPVVETDVKKLGQRMFQR